MLDNTQIMSINDYVKLMENHLSKINIQIPSYLKNWEFSRKSLGKRKNLKKNNGF